MDSVIQMVLDGNWTDLTRYTEQRAADKITETISSKKDELKTRFNAGFDDEPTQD